MGDDKKKKAQKGSGLNASSSTSSSQPAGASSAAAAAKAKSRGDSKKKGGWFSSSSKSDKDSSDNTKSVEKESASMSQDMKQTNGKSNFDIPRDFNEMMRLNAAMTGCNMDYIELVLKYWEIIVNHHIKTGQATELTDILALEIAKELIAGKGIQVKLSEFKVCLLASMRSLMSARWDMQHEKAWSWTWDCVEEQLRESLPARKSYQNPVKSYLKHVDSKAMDDLCLAAWNRMFQHDPNAEHFFRQSNGRLIFIGQKALEFSGEFYADPAGMYIQMEALGLKHIANRVEPKFFPIFIHAMADELAGRGAEDIVVKGIQWSMTLIGMILSRSVIEGGLLQVR